MIDRRSSGQEVQFVIPASIDDPRRPSGGNVYDRRLIAELPRWGWTVREHPVPGAWPVPEPSEREQFAALVDNLPDDSIVLVDGLIASAAENLVDAARRLRVVVLLHMPLADALPEDSVKRVEAAVLNAADAVITTSGWAREWVIAHLGLTADRVWTARPGVDAVQPAQGTTTGGNLLCAGPVTPAKGHDVLVAALAKVADLEWLCTCAGALDLDPGFVESLVAAAASAGLADRIQFPGPLSRSALDDLRAHVDLVVSPSRREAYGMAVTEGLAHGIPVIATAVGGHAEAVGQAADGAVPGTLVPPGDPDILADALRRWLTDPATRREWQRAARLRSTELASWSETAQAVAAVLQEISTKPDSGPERV